MSSDLFRKTEGTHHRRSVAILVLALVVFAGLIIAYLSNPDSSDYVSTQAPTQSLKTMMAAQLKQSPQTQLSDLQKTAVAAYLSKKGTAPTSVEKLDMVNALKAH